MPSESATVVAIEADALWVETVRRSACGGCSAQKGCGQALLNREFEGRRGRIRILPGACAVSQFSVGDHVLLDIPDEIILRGSLVAYGLPLLGMLAGAMAAEWWLSGHGDLAAVTGAVVGLLSGFALVCWHGIRHRHDPAIHPVIRCEAISLEQALPLR